MGGFAKMGEIKVHGKSGLASARNSKRGRGLKVIGADVKS